MILHFVTIGKTPGEFAKCIYQIQHGSPNRRATHAQLVVGCSWLCILGKLNFNSLLFALPNTDCLFGETGTSIILASKGILFKNTFYCQIRRLCKHPLELVLERSRHLSQSVHDQNVPIK